MNDNKVISTWRNTEGELLTIQKVTGGDFTGRYVLCIHDDDPPLGTGTVAPMLLDEGTRQFLMSEMDELGDLR